jgi:hypothetical protein
MKIAKCSFRQSSRLRFLLLFDARGEFAREEKSAIKPRLDCTWPFGTRAARRARYRHFFAILSERR